ncbi:hypothetical protein C8J57DRAFT_1218741 [Mycena rebaudengoi]|nr:hypothetical protein C8J57DRAFT_1218741 [Mycena rebaudengoi]
MPLDLSLRLPLDLPRLFLRLCSGCTWVAHKIEITADPRKEHTQTALGRGREDFGRDGSVLKSEPDVRGEQAEKWYWDTLRTKFEKAITVLEESMKEQQSGQVAVAAEVEMT